MEPRIGVEKLEDRTGQGLMEYAMILVLVALVAIAGLSLVGGAVSSLFNTVASSWPS